MTEVDKVSYFRVDRRNLVYLKFILEAYEGLSTMSTADRKEGIVRISCPEWAAADVRELLDSLSREIGLIEVDEPMEAMSA